MTEVTVKSNSLQQACPYHWITNSCLFILDVVRFNFLPEDSCSFCCLATAMSLLLLVHFVGFVFDWCNMIIKQDKTVHGHKMDITELAGDCMWRCNIKSSQISQDKAVLLCLHSNHPPTLQLTQCFIVWNLSAILSIMSQQQLHLPSCLLEWSFGRRAAFLLRCFVFGILACRCG